MRSDGFSSVVIYLLLVCGSCLEAIKEPLEKKYCVELGVCLVGTRQATDFAVITCSDGVVCVCVNVCVCVSSWQIVVAKTVTEAVLSSLQCVYHVCRAGGQIFCRQCDLWTAGEVRTNEGQIQKLPWCQQRVHTQHSC